MYCEVKLLFFIYLWHPRMKVRDLVLILSCILLIMSVICNGTCLFVSGNDLRV